MALTQKERSARNYKSKKENGLCPRCGKPLDRKGYYCSSCLEKNRIYRQENRDFFRENHLCTECGKNKVPDGERICPECRAKRLSWKKPLTEDQKEYYELRFRTQQRMLYQERAESGICTRCAKRKAAPGRRKCKICLSKDAELHKKMNLDKPNEREFRKEHRLCYFCGDKIDLPTGRICSCCMEKFKKNGEKYGGRNRYWKKDNEMIFGGKKHE